MELPTKYQSNILRDHILFQVQLKQEVFDKQELWFFEIRSQGPKFEFCNKKCLENNLILSAYIFAYPSQMVRSHYSYTQIEDIDPNHPVPIYV